MVGWMGLDIVGWGEALSRYLIMIPRTTKFQPGEVWWWVMPVWEQNTCFTLSPLWSQSTNQLKTNGNSHKSSFPVTRDAFSCNRYNLKSLQYAVVFRSHENTHGGEVLLNHYNLWFQLHCNLLSTLASACFAHPLISITQPAALRRLEIVTKYIYNIWMGVFMHKV